MRNTRETLRLKKEELVKTCCCWFSEAEFGLASVTMAFLSNKEMFLTDHSALLFEEIGRVVKLFHLCQARSNSQDLSYSYLKETRLALTMIFNETMKLFIALSLSSHSVRFPRIFSRFSFLEELHKYVEFRALFDLVDSWYFVFMAWKKAGNSNWNLRTKSDNICNFSYSVHLSKTPCMW